MTHSLRRTSDWGWLSMSSPQLPLTWLAWVKRNADGSLTLDQHGRPTLWLHKWDAEQADKNNLFAPTRKLTEVRITVDHAAAPSIDDLQRQLAEAKQQITDLHTERNLARRQYKWLEERNAELAAQSERRRVLLEKHQYAASEAMMEPDRYPNVCPECGAFAGTSHHSKCPITREIGDAPVENEKEES